MKATITSQPIVATVSGSTVSATVTSSSSTVTAGGGVGPAGTDGGPLGQLSDVQLAGVADGDVLRYAGGKWRNKSESQLIDGGAY